MLKVYYEYKQGPIKEIGRVINVNGDLFTIEIYNSRFSSTKFIRNSKGKYQALGTSNTFNFIIE